MGQGAMKHKMLWQRQAALREARLGRGSSGGAGPAFDHGAGAARVRAEAVRVAQVKAAGSLPAEAGPAVVRCAPGRGPVTGHAPVRMVPDGAEGWRAVDDRFDGRACFRRGDVFDRPGLAGLPPGLVAHARKYRAVTERHAATGMRCASLEGVAARGAGGSGAGEDVLIDRGLWLDAQHRRIGPGIVLAVRRVRPDAARPAARSGITARRLVDDVCLHDFDLSAVLRKYGWAEKGPLRAVLRQALKEALERMVGGAQKRGLTA